MNQLSCTTLTIPKGSSDLYNSVILLQGCSFVKKSRKISMQWLDCCYILKVISCIHESIITPANEEGIYRNRKHFQSHEYACSVCCQKYHNKNSL